MAEELVCSDLVDRLRSYSEVLRAKELQQVNQVGVQAIKFELSHDSAHRGVLAEEHFRLATEDCVVVAITEREISEVKEEQDYSKRVDIGLGRTEWFVFFIHFWRANSCCGILLEPNLLVHPCLRVCCPLNLMQNPSF